jgi:hypothetical protein
MNRDSMKALHLDRRLLRRRGWIAPEELEKQLAALPDVADKAAPLEAEPAAAAAEPTAESPAPAAPENPAGPETPGGF